MTWDRPRRRLLALDLVALFIVVVWVLTFCGSARADDCDRYVAIAQGSTAPCDGVLSSAGEMARFLLLEDERDKLKVDLVAEREQHAITRAEGAELLRVCDASRRVCEERQAPPPVVRAWWDSPWVGAVVGVVVGVGVTVGVVAATR